MLMPREINGWKEFKLKLFNMLFFHKNKSNFGFYNAKINLNLKVFEIKAFQFIFFLKWFFVGYCAKFKLS